MAALADNDLFIAIVIPLTVVLGFLAVAFCTKKAMDSWDRERDRR